MPATARFRLETLGAGWEIGTPEPLPKGPRREVLARAEALDATWSRFCPDSVAVRMAEAPTGGRFRFPDDGAALFDLCDRLHAATGGAVDPPVGRDLELPGDDRAYPPRPQADRRRGHPS